MTRLKAWWHSWWWETLDTPQRILLRVIAIWLWMFVALPLMHFVLERVMDGTGEAEK